MPLSVSRDCNGIKGRPNIFNGNPRHLSCTSKVCNYWWLYIALVEGNLTQGHWSVNHTNHTSQKVLSSNLEGRTEIFSQLMFWLSVSDTNTRSINTSLPNLQVRDWTRNFSPASESDITGGTLISCETIHVCCAICSQHDRCREGQAYA